MSCRLYFLILAISIIMLPVKYLFGDAYLAEENIHYGADSYKINYEKEIITARGNAYFKKGNKLILADKIVIFYSKDISKAECFGNVILKDKDNNSIIRGHYGFVKYSQKLYYLSGNVSYSREDVSISSDKLFYYSKENLYIFQDNVFYKNDNYSITSDKLEIDINKAEFYGEVVLVNNEKSEILSSRYMEYSLKDDNSLFKGNVIYQSSSPENLFLVYADAIEFMKDLNTYYLINNVFIISNSYRINADFMVYDKNKDYLKAIGNVIARNKKFQVRGDTYTIDNINKEIDVLREVRGVYKN